VATNAVGSRARGAGFSEHTIHAERHAVKTLGDVSLLRGADMYVLRLPGPGMAATAAAAHGVARVGGDAADVTPPTFLYSRPCADCALFLVKCQRRYGLRNVYYTTDLAMPHIADVGALAARKRDDAVAATGVAPAAKGPSALTIKAAAAAAAAAARGDAVSSHVASAAHGHTPPTACVGSSASVASTLTLSTASVASAGCDCDDALSAGVCSGAHSIAGDSACGGAAYLPHSGGGGDSGDGASAPCAGADSLRLLRGGDGSEEAERAAFVWGSSATADDIDLLLSPPTASLASRAWAGGVVATAAAAAAARPGAKLVMPARSVERAALPASAFVDRIAESRGVGYGRTLASLRGGSGDGGSDAPRKTAVKQAAERARAVLPAAAVACLVRNKRGAAAAAIAELPTAAQRKRAVAAIAALEAARVTDESRRRRGGGVGGVAR